MVRGFYTVFAYLLYHENEAGKKKEAFQLVFLRYRLIYDAKVYVTLPSQMKKCQIRYTVNLLNWSYLLHQMQTRRTFVGVGAKYSQSG